MATHDIPRENWAAFLDEFSRTRLGALVTIETVDPQSDPQIEAKAMPLVGLTFEHKGGEEDTISLILGTEADDQISHTIAGPKHLYHKTGAGIISDEINAGEILEITASSHPAITQLQFHPRP